MFGKNKQANIPEEDLNTIRYKDLQNTSSQSSSGGFKLFSKKKSKKTKIDIPKTPNELVECLFSDYDMDSGMMKLSDDTYSLCFRFKDIAFAKIDYADAVEVFCTWRGFLDTLTPDIHLQIVNSNKQELTSAYKKKYRLKDESYPGRENISQLRNEFNRLIDGAIGKKKTTLITTKYLVLSTKAESWEDANKKLGLVVQAAKKTMEDLGSSLEPVSIDERLEIIYDTLNPDLAKAHFRGTPITQAAPQMKDKTGRIYSVWDAIAPEYINLREYKMIESHNSPVKGSPQKFMSVLYVSKYANEMSPVFFNSLMNLENVSAMSTLNIQPVNNEKYLRMIQNQLTSMAQERLEKVKRANRNGYDYELVKDLDLQDKIDRAQGLLGDITSNGQKIFECNILICVTAESYDELKNSIAKVVACGSENLLTIQPIYAEQLEGLKNSLPLGWNDILFKRTMTTEAATVNIPFTSEDLMQSTGLFLGTNQISKQPIFFDNKKLNNQNSVVLATSGAGKSYTTKLLMEQILIKYPNDLVIVIDPQGEYQPIVDAFSGTTLKISNDSNTIINPFDISDTYGLSEGKTDPINEKAEFVIGFIETLNNEPLSAGAKSIIDRTVREAYQFARNSNFTQPRLIPNLRGFYAYLQKQPEPEAKELVQALERFVTTRNIFNGYTNIDMQNRFVCFDVKDIPDSMLSTGYLVVLDFIMNKISQNAKRGTRTWLFADEFHVLMNNDYAAEYLAKLWKVGRKFNLSPTAITQNLDDILDNEHGKKIISNSETAILLKNKESDIPVLQKFFGISDNMSSYLSSARQGEGLLVYGKTVLPYTFRIDPNTYINKLNNTTAQ